MLTEHSLSIEGDFCAQMGSFYDHFKVYLEKILKFVQFILLSALIMQKSLKVFVACVTLWEIAVGLLYGFLLGYFQTSFTAMFTGSTNSYYFSTDAGTIKNFTINSTQFPYPHIVISVAIILLIVGNFIDI